MIAIDLQIIAHYACRLMRSNPRFRAVLAFLYRDSGHAMEAKIAYEGIGRVGKGKGFRRHNCNRRPKITIVIVVIHVKEKKKRNSTDKIDNRQRGEAERYPISQYRSKTVVDQFAK